MSLAYDVSDNLIQLTYPDGFAVGYDYDALNRVTAANQLGAGARTLASVSYDALSRRDVVSYANGASARHVFSARGDLVCHGVNLTGAAPGACAVTTPGYEARYDFTYNGARQLLTAPRAWGA